MFILLYLNIGCSSLMMVAKSSAVSRNYASKEFVIAMYRDLYLNLFGD